MHVKGFEWQPYKGDPTPAKHAPGIIGWDNDISGSQHTPNFNADLGSLIQNSQAEQQRRQKMPGLILKKFSQGKSFR